MGDDLHLVERPEFNEVGLRPLATAEHRELPLRGCGKRIELTTRLRADAIGDEFAQERRGLDRLRGVDRCLCPVGIERAGAIAQQPRHDAREIGGGRVHAVDLAGLCQGGGRLEELIPGPFRCWLGDTGRREDLRVVPDRHRVEFAGQVIGLAIRRTEGSAPLHQLGVEVGQQGIDFLGVALDEVVDRVDQAAAREQALALGCDLHHVERFPTGDPGRDGIGESGP